MEFKGVLIDTSITESPAKIDPRQRSHLFLLTIGLFGLAISFNINMLDPFFYSEKIRLLAPPEIKNTMLGLLTIVALAVAFLVQPVIGRWSDRAHSRWGRRAPYLAIGAVGVALALGLVVTATSLWLLIIGVMLVSAFSNTAQAAWHALVPDQVPEAQHGAAAGFKTVLEMIGGVAGAGLTGLLLARGQLLGPPLLAISLFLMVLAATLLALRGSSSPAGPAFEVEPPASPSNLLARIRQSPPAFWWWSLNRVLFWSSAIAIRTFLLNYLNDVLGLSPGEAQALSGRLLVVLGLGIFLIALPAGMMVDRLGRRPLLMAAGVVAAGGGVVLLTGRDLTLLFAGCGLIAVGAGIYASASWALATTLVPRTNGAWYLALANSVIIIGSASGRLGGPVIDGVNWFFGTVALGYQVVFAVAVLFFAGSSLAALMIKTPITT
ncbi:MAG: MFS transporter [Anaerolineaceae bacterium]|nr:MFS transporter [Anaerolineaceae bacterium]MCB9101723.1 MFS transporter [Anaerolineales bacterium]